MLYLGFVPPFSACVLTQSCTLPVTHAAKHTQLIHPYSLAHAIRQPDSWPRPPGGEDGPVWGIFVGGDEPGSSAVSPAIHIQWVHSHTSDSVADWGRGLSRVAPSPVGGPENCVCGSSQFVIKVLFCWVVLFFSLFLIFGCPWWSPVRHRVFSL